MMIAFTTGSPMTRRIGGVVEQRPGVNAKVLSSGAAMGGLNHRYTRDQAVRIHFNCRVSVAYVAAKVGPGGVTGAYWRVKIYRGYG